MSRQLISANHAAAEAVAMSARANKNARGFASGIYPITPQTECIEYLAKQEIEKSSIVRVESEHSAMGVCIGGALSGARTFTASASNGLSYMVENIATAGFYRLPVLMYAVNRTLGPPWNIWVDHGDTLQLRDAGWMHVYCEDNQEVMDSIFFAYRLMEDHRILLPMMVCADAFVLSHTMMMTDIPTQEQVDKFLPDLHLPHAIDTDPVTVGGLDFPRETEVHRRQHQEAFDLVPEVYAEAQTEFESIFGRKIPDRVVPYRMEDAEVALVCISTFASTVKPVVDKLREQGIKAGLVRLRMLRPYPEQEMKEVLSGVERIGVLDRDISLGMGGVIWSETRGCAPDSIMQNFMIGLGGGDVRAGHIENIFTELLEQKESGKPRIVEVG